MKPFVALLCSLFFFNAHAIDISEVRNLYRQASESEENTEKFHNIIQKTNYKEDPVLSAYYGCSLALKAGHSWSIFDKISFFKRGKKIIDEAVVSDPNNIEIRLIRLSVQSNVPKITGYYKNIEADKDFINKNIKYVTSMDLKELIEGFMYHTEMLENN